MGILLAILFALVFLNRGMNVWAMHRQGSWSLFEEARFWYGYPLWLEQLAGEAKPGSSRRIAALAGLAVILLLVTLAAAVWIGDWFHS